MDLKRFEKIEAVEAIALLEKGEVVYTEGGTKFRLDGDFELEGQSVERYSFTSVELSLGWILKQTWYKTRPFDVRQAMRDKPDEWVGKFESDSGGWFALGFDSNEFRAVFVPLSQAASIKTNGAHDRVFTASKWQIDKTVPFDEVSK